MVSGSAHNLVNCSLCYYGAILKISSKSVYNFSSNVDNRQTNQNGQKHIIDEGNQKYLTLDSDS